MLQIIKTVIYYSFNYNYTDLYVINKFYIYNNILIMSSELQNINVKSKSIDFNSLTGINFKSGTSTSYGSEFSKQMIDVNNMRIKGTIDLSDLVLSGNINTQFISSIFDVNQDSMLDSLTSKSTSDQYEEVVLHQC